MCGVFFFFVWGPVRVNSGALGAHAVKGLLQLEAQVVVSCLMLMLGTELSLCRSRANS